MIGFAVDSSIDDDAEAHLETSDSPYGSKSENWDRQLTRSQRQPPALENKSPPHRTVHQWEESSGRVPYRFSSRNPGW